MQRSLAVSIAVIVGALVLIVGAALLVVRPWESEPVAEPQDVLDPTTHVLDDAGEGAPMVVEFLDYQCPTGAQLHPIVEELRAEHAGEVSFAVRYLPLPMHAQAIPAAIAAEAAAQQGELDAMQAILFERQADWSGADDADAQFRGYAEELGLDMPAYDAAVADPATLDRVALDANAAASLGLTGTPSFFVDGVRVELSHVDDLGEAIDAALAD